MINTPTSDIKFTNEQNEQIVQFRTVLSNLQYETSATIKTNRALELERDKTTKEKEYQDQLLADLTPKVEEKKKQFDGFNEEINKATSVLAKLQEEIKTKTAEQEEKDEEFQVKSDDLDKIIAEYNTKTTQSNKREASLQKDETLFNQKVAKLKEVISEF